MKKLLFLGIFFATASVAIAQQRVNGARAVISLHPAKIEMESRKGLSYSVFYDLMTKSLFITSEKEIAEAITEHLPVVPSNTSVVIDGAAINLFQVFSKKELKKASQRLGQNLKYVTAFQITNYGLLGGNSKKTDAWGQ